MTTSYSEDNKRILKNIIALYLRQIITMLVALFTSRVIFRTLGEEDFGINNIVGGIVVMMSFLTNSLSGTTQRFLNVELGKGDKVKLKQVFANSLSLHVILILLILILAETAGLWFLKNKLVIPHERMNAAFWVYQFSVISFTVNVFSAPFLGAIRAHEKFDFYAKLAIYDVVMMLVIAYMIMYVSYDKLIVYAFLGGCGIIIGKIIMYIYCYVNFEECRLKFSICKDGIKDLLGYNAYALIMNITLIANNKTLDFVLNIFHGPILNAAQGIATQVYNALSMFSINAMLATTPQIIKSYAQDDRQRLYSLITRSSKLYLFLTIILTLPFILEIDTALHLWLGKYPEYAAVFTRILLLEVLLLVLLTPIDHANNAVGKLRPNTINVTTVRLLFIASAIFMGMKGLSPVYIYYFKLVFNAISVLISMIIVLKHQLKFSLYKYFIDVILPSAKTGVIVVSLPVAAHIFFSKTIILSCVVGIFTFCWSIIVIFFVGLNRDERQMVINKFTPLLRNRFK